MASSSLLGSSPKALLKLPGVEKRPEASGRCLITGGKIVTTLDSKQVLQLLGKGKYPVNIDLCEAHFQIETDEFLRHIKDVLASLDLSSNCLKQLTSLNRFSKLKRLVVENNLLTTIEVAGLVSLEYLSLEGNQLVSLFNLVDLKKLVHLNLANNKICTGWHNLLSHKALKVLDLSNNSIDLTSKQFEADAFPGLRNLSALSYLALEGNPTAKKVPQFRAFVIHSFSKLKFLDWQAVSKQEQKAAETLCAAAPWHVEAVSVRKTVNRISRPVPEADLPHHHISVASASGSVSGDDSNNKAATDPSSSPVPAAAPPAAAPPLASLASQSPTASTSTDPLEAFLSGDDSALYSFIAQPSAPSSGQPVKTETASESLDQLLGSLERPSSPAVAAPTPSPAAIAAVSPPRAAPAAAAAQRPVSSMESTQKSLDELLGSLESINAPQPLPAPVATVVAPTNAQESLDSLLGSLESMTSAPVAAPPPAAKPAQLKRTNTAAQLDLLLASLEDASSTALPEAPSSSPSPALSPAPAVSTPSPAPAPVSPSPVVLPVAIALPTKPQPAAHAPPVRADSATQLAALLASLDGGPAAEVPKPTPAPAAGAIDYLSVLDNIIEDVSGTKPPSASNSNNASIDDLHTLATSMSVPSHAPVAVLAARLPAAASFSDSFDEIEKSLNLMLPSRPVEQPRKDMFDSLDASLSQMLPPAGNTAAPPSSLSSLDALDQAINAYSSSQAPHQRVSSAAAAGADLFSQLEAAIGELSPAAAPAAVPISLESDTFGAHLRSVELEQVKLRRQQEEARQISRAGAEFEQAQLDAQRLRDLATAEGEAIKARAMADANETTRKALDEAKAESVRIKREAEESRLRAETQAMEMMAAERARIEAEKRRLEEERARAHSEAMKREEEMYRKEQERREAERARVLKEQQDKLQAAELAHQEELARKAREHELAMAAALERQKLLEEAEQRRRDAERQQLEAERRLQGADRMKTLETERIATERVRLEKDAIDKAQWAQHMANRQQPALVGPTVVIGGAPLHAYGHGGDAFAMPSSGPGVSLLDAALLSVAAGTGGSLPFTNPWEAKFSELTTAERLGAGVLGVTFRGVWNGQQVSLKKFKCQRLDPAMLTGLRREAGALMLLRHPGLVGLVGMCFDTELMSIHQFVQGISLQAFLQNPGNVLDTRDSLRVSLEIATGVAYLHSQNIVHGNLKSANVLLDSDMKPRLRDYGLPMLKTETFRTNCVGTPSYYAPEFLQSPMGTHASPIDVFSLSVVVCEIFSREAPFPDQLPIEHKNMILKGIRPIVPLPPQCPSVINRLIEAGWQADPSARPPIDRVVAILSTPVDKILAYDGSVTGPPATSSSAPSSTSASPPASQFSRSATPASASGPAAKVDVPADDKVHSVIARIVELLNNPDPNRQTAALKALTNVGKVPSNSSAIVSSSLIPQIVGLLSSSNMTLSESACHALESVCINEQVKRRIADAGALPHLIGLLSSPVPLLQIASGKCLDALLAECPQNVVAARAIGVLPGLVKCMKTQNDSVQLQAVTTLAHVLSDHASHGDLPTLHVVELLIHLLQSGNPGIQFRALVGLGLLVDNPAFSATLAQHDIIRRFAQLLAVKSPLLNREAASALARFSLQPTLRAEIQKSGAIAALIPLLHDTAHPEIHPIVLNLFSEFARDQRFTDDLRIAHGFPVLIKMLANTAEPQLQSRAADVLADLIANNPANQAQFRASGGLPPVIGLMTSPTPDHVKISLLLGSQLLEDPECVAAFSTAGVAPLIKVMLADGQPDSHQIQHVCHILSKICEDPRNRAGIVHGKLIPLLINTSSASSNQLTRTYALQTLSSVSADTSTASALCINKLDFLLPYLNPNSEAACTLALSLLANIAMDPTTHPNFLNQALFAALAPTLISRVNTLQALTLKIFLLLARNNVHNKAALSASPLVPVFRTLLADPGSTAQIKAASQAILGFIE